MRRKTKRTIRRFFGVPLAIIGAVFTVGSVIAASLMPFPGWIWTIVIASLSLISWGLIYIYSKVSAPKIEYFEHIDFGTPDENTIRTAVEGILNTEKAAPFYVHAAPTCNEVETVYLRLNDAGFAMISGRPGEGKSMVAYHAAWRLQNILECRVYALKAGELEKKTGEEVLDEILFQLDRLKGKKKLILMDDAHKLALKEDIYTILQQEAKEGHGKYIWIETELYGDELEKIKADAYIRINFLEFLETLLKGFYRSQNPVLQKTLGGRIKGLQDAIDRVHKNKILDVWWFAFCTSRGEERLAREVDYLSNPELLVLFLVSAYTVLSAEAELNRNDLVNMVNNLKFGWLVDELKKSSVGDVIKSLQSRKLIRLYDKSKSDRGYIASLHYNFARAVLQASLHRESLVGDLLASVKALLTDEYRKCIYFAVFHHDIGAYASKFTSENKDWLISFVNNPLPEWLQCYPVLLRSVQRINKDTYNEITGELDTNSIAKKISGTKAEKLQQLAYLLDGMGKRRGELIEKLDLTQLSKTADNAEVGQFKQIAYLLDAMGDRRGELIEKLDVAQLSKTADGAEVGHFEQLAHLLNAMGDRRGELIEKLDVAQLSKTADGAEVRQFSQLAYLLNAMRKRRGELIEKLDLTQLSKTAGTAKAEQFEQLINLLDALGEKRDLFVDELIEDNKILEELAQTVSSAPADRYQDIANLLDGFGSRKTNLITLLDYDSLVEKANKAHPDDVRGLTLFMSRLEEEHRNRLHLKVDWASLCMRCTINAGLLRSLGGCLENLCKQAEMLSDKTGCDKVARYLRSRVNEIVQEIENAYELARKHIPLYASLYAGVGKFLWNCNKIDPILACEVTTKTMSKLIECFWITPANYDYVGQLIDALHVISPDLSESFLKNNKIRGRIQESINTDDWSGAVEDLKHLIEAFYRSDPDLWRRMVNSNWILVDLSSLDLDSIYKDVDEEKDAGTA